MSQENERDAGSLDSCCQRLEVAQHGLQAIKQKLRELGVTDPSEELNTVLLMYHSQMFGHVPDLTYQMARRPR